MLNYEAGLALGQKANLTVFLPSLCQSQVTPTRDILGSSKMSVCGDTNNCCWTFIIYTNSINVCESNVFVGTLQAPKNTAGMFTFGTFP